MSTPAEQIELVSEVFPTLGLNSILVIEALLYSAILEGVELNSTFYQNADLISVLQLERC